MSIKKIFVTIICFVCYASSVVANNKAYVTYLAPKYSEEVTIVKQLKDSGVVDTVIEQINTHFLLSDSLHFVFGGDDGPLYDGDTQQIIIPYAFIQEVKQRFVEAKYAETGVNVNDATIDVLIHTLFHELAHALIFMHQLPVLGKEEDAADSLATILLIELFEEGQEIAISAADLFDLESEDKTVLDEEDFWGEHSLDAQRFYSTLCHVYGSAPTQYAHLREDVGFSQERAELCIDEYEALLKSWFTLLEPYMKH